MPALPAAPEPLDTLNDIPMEPGRRIPEGADLGTILNFFNRPREIDIFAQLGDCPSAPEPSGLRYYALNVPGEHILVLDHVYGPGRGLQTLAERFELDPIAHMDATRYPTDIVLFLAEADTKRLGTDLFARKAARALREAVAAIPAGDAERALAGMTEEVRLSLISAGVLARRHLQGLPGRARDEVFTGDLGL